jgi:hypothetical protein
MSCRLFCKYVLVLITFALLLFLGCGNSNEKAAAELAPDSSEVIKMPENLSPLDVIPVGRKVD